MKRTNLGLLNGRRLGHGQNRSHQGCIGWRGTGGSDRLTVVHTQRNLLGNGLTTGARPPISFGAQLRVMQLQVIRPSAFGATFESWERLKVLFPGYLARAIILGVSIVPIAGDACGRSIEPGHRHRSVDLLSLRIRLQLRRRLLLLLLLLVLLLLILLLLLPLKKLLLLLLLLLKSRLPLLMGQSVGGCNVLLLIISRGILLLIQLHLIRARSPVRSLLLLLLLNRLRPTPRGLLLRSIIDPSGTVATSFASSSALAPLTLRGRLLARGRVRLLLKLVGTGKNGLLMLLLLLLTSFLLRLLPLLFFPRLLLVTFCFQMTKLLAPGALLSNRQTSSSCTPAGSCWCGASSRRYLFGILLLMSLLNLVPLLNGFDCLSVRCRRLRPMP